MNEWLTVGRLATGLNLVLLAGLSYIWLRNYLDHGARHTLALLIFGGFLVVENVVWLYLYVVAETYVAWYLATTVDIQIAITSLCVLETVALLVLARLTWQ